MELDGEGDILLKKETRSSHCPSRAGGKNRILLRNPCISNFISIPAGHLHN
jgi:hypothetical protein